MADSGLPGLGEAIAETVRVTDPFFVYGRINSGLALLITAPA
jgi:hypothetical protein